MQARIGTAETAHKKLEAKLTQLRPRAATLEQQLSQSQVKLKAAQADVTDLRAEALHSKVRIDIAVLTVSHTVPLYTGIVRSKAWQILKTQSCCLTQLHLQ